MYYVEYFLFLVKQEINSVDKFKILYNFIKRSIRLELFRIIRNLKKEGVYKLINIESLLPSMTVLKSKVKRNNEISKPNIFNESKELKMLQGNVPDINIIEIKKCKIISKTSSIILGQNIYNDNLSRMKVFHDLKNPINQTIESISSKNISIYVADNITIKSTPCIHLLNEHSNNYYHLLFEVLPKFILINDYISSSEKYSKLEYLILVDENTPKQFIEIIKYFSNIRYTIKYVPNHTIMNIDTLIFCTDLWNSLDNTNFIPNIKEEFFVDRFAIETIKKNIKPLEMKPFRKIYFQRKSTQARYLKNTKELEKLLNEYDFEFILPETLSFQEQITILGESKIIIGISGAVFSNIVFMQENTNAIIFSPNTIASNYYVFQPMADVAKVNLTHILTKNVFHESIHANSYIDIYNVEKLLTLMNIRKEIFS